MAVEGVHPSGTARVEQMIAKQREDEAVAAERRRRQEENEREAQELRRATETGRGEQVDVTA